mgnify:CR=1 FL=1
MANRVGVRTALITGALAEGIYSYRHVKTATEALVAQALAAIDRADAAPAQGELALTQEHPLIRSSDDYAELFARAAAQPDTANNTPTTPMEFKA